MFTNTQSPYNLDGAVGLLGNDDINGMTLAGGAVVMGTVGGATLVATMAFPGQILTGLALGTGAIVYGQYERSNDDASKSTVTVDAKPTGDDA